MCYNINSNAILQLHITLYSYEKVGTLGYSIYHTNFEVIHDEVNETVAYIDKDIFNLDEILRGKLRKYRYDKSKKLGYKPYYIFNDKTLNDLILKKPQNEAELKKICGISDIKIKKYGKDILKIINK